MLKYNNTHIITGYIKQLLHSFNLPTIRVYKKGMLILENNFYIYKNKVVKALVTTQEVNSSSFKIINTYNYNKKLPHFSKNLEIRNNIYDSYTHKYLGEYLRFQRDYNNLNLMSMYNCFSNEMPNNLYISSSNPSFNFNSEEYGYKIYMLPINLFEEYTIAIDSDKPVEIVCGFYNKTQDIRTQFLSFYNHTYRKINRCSFNTPFIYDNVKNITKNMLINTKAIDNEHQLKMFIKLPITNTSSIVVVEGDYTKYNDFILKDLGKLTSNNISINNFEYINNNYDVKLISKLQLFSVNSSINHPFADRLIEYLVDNSITNLETIDDNLRKLQLALSDKYKIPVFGNYGIWEDKYKYILYDIAVKENLINSKKDVLGYCDKDLEQKLFTKELENKIYKEEIK